MRFWPILLSMIAATTAMIAWTVPARSEQAVWGFAVYDAEGAFVASRWPDARKLDIGSGSSTFLPLEGLSEKHASFEVDDRSFTVIPYGDVKLNGAPVSARTEFGPEDTLLVGRYRFQFFRTTEDTAERGGEASGREGDGDGTYEEGGGDDTPEGDVPGEAPAPRPDALDPAVAAEKAAAGRSNEFSKSAYRFCHDPDFGKNGTDGVDFCTLFDEGTEEVCPEARKSCPKWVPLPARHCPPGEKCTGRGEGKRRVTRRESDRSLGLSNLRLPPLLSYILIGAALALVLMWFLRSLKNAGWESEKGGADPGTGDITEAERNLQALPEARSHALLTLAERALARGEGKEAAVLLHLSVLRHLDDEGLAPYHPSKTNGDYLRAIRRHRPLAALFRSVANQTERIRFGDGLVDPGAVDLYISDARRLLVHADEGDRSGFAEAGATMLLAGSLLIFGNACGDDARDPAYHSRAPTGMAALPALLKEAGLEVEISRTRIATIPANVGAVVLRSSASDQKHWPEALRLDGLLDRNISVVVIDDLWRSDFFLPVTSSVSHGNAAVDLELSPPSPDVFCSWKLSGLSDLADDETLRLPEGRRLVWDGSASTATVSAKAMHLHPLLVYRAGARAVVGGGTAAVAFTADRVENDTALAGCLYVFSDRDLFTNASLTRASNAGFVAAFFASLVPDGRRIVILDRLDQWTISEAPDGRDEKQEGPPSPTAPLKASNMLPFIAQAAITLIALYILVGAAFGPLRDPVLREHKAFIEHVEAIGRQYARTGVMGLTHAARSLARLVVMRNRDQLRGGTAGGWSHVAEHLAHKLDLEEKDVRAALRLGIDGVSELGAPTPDDPTPSSERMLRTLSRLLGARERAAKKRRAQRRGKSRHSEGGERSSAEGQ